jgi:LysR family transcriptional activator of glutamate synthase operon
MTLWNRKPEKKGGTAMNLQQMRSFTTVAQLENISQAASLLHISQSSLSKNMAKLEEELGMPLFDRGGRGIRLNAQGARFLQYTTQMLRELELTQEEMREQTTGTESKIRIGTAGSNRLLLEGMASFVRAHPGTQFDLNCSIERETRPDINSFDVMIYPEDSRFERFKGYPFYEERYYLALPASHPLAQHISIHPKLLKGESFVFLRGQDGFIEYPFRVCSALAVPFGTVCYADTREMHRQIIAEGIAIGFVPEGALPLYQGDTAIRLLPLLDQRFSRRMWICFRKEKHLPALARSFRDHMITTFHLCD